MNITKDFTDKDDGYVHPTFLGLTPLPKVRCYILPDKGGKFIHRDLSQQELRLLAHFEDGRLCAAYKANPEMDVHDFVGGLLEQHMGVKLQRRLTKILNFGKIYGMGVKGFMEKMRCTKDQAEQFVRAHKAALPDVKKLEEDIKWRARKGQPIRTWGGRLYHVETPRLINGRMCTFEYKLLNYLIQGSAADWTKEACIRYNTMKKDGRLMVTIHDELDISAPKRAVKSELKLLKTAMEDMPLDVPMLSDAKVGDNWGELKKVEG